MACAMGNEYRKSIYKTNILILWKSQNKKWRVAPPLPFICTMVNFISVADDEDFISKEELQSIQKGLDDIKNGRTRKMLENESLTDFLKRTETCMK